MLRNIKGQPFLSFHRGKKRKKLFIQRGGNIKHFNLFDKRQIQPQRKIQKSDYVIYNDKSLKNLKEKVKILKLKLLKYA